MSIFRHISSLLALAALFTFAAGCSAVDDEAPAPEPEAGPAASRASVSDSLFVKVRIVTPRLTTRAYDQGYANEYAVSTGYLLIFEGASEAAATLTHREDISSYLANMDDEPTAEITKCIPVVPGTYATDNHFYALVMLNHTGLIDPATLPASTTLASLQTGNVLSDYKTTAGDYFMSNSPVKKGAAIITMPEVTTYLTAADAAQAQATTIFVERAAAKVSVSCQRNIATALTINGTTALAHIHDIQWGVRNYESTVYPVRLFNSADAALVGSAVADGYSRTLWGEGINYGSTPANTTTSSLVANGISMTLPESTYSTEANAPQAVIEAQLQTPEGILFKKAYWITGTEGSPTVVYSSARELFRAVIGKIEGANPLEHYWSSYAIAHRTFDELFDDNISITLDANGKIAAIDLNATAYPAGEQSDITTLAATLLTACQGTDYTTYGNDLGKIYLHKKIENSSTATTGKYGLVRDNQYDIRLTTVDAIDQTHSIP